MKADAKARPSILVFATHTISDPGIDLAGSSHMDYSPTVKVIALPCSSGMDPRWVLHALKTGFDGVFLAADGTDCAYLPDCTKRTGEVADRTQAMLKEEGLEAKRFKMAAICSVCAESFVSTIESFEKVLSGLSQGK